MFQFHMTEHPRSYRAHLYLYGDQHPPAEFNEWLADQSFAQAEAPVRQILGRHTCRAWSGAISLFWRQREAHHLAMADAPKRSRPRVRLTTSVCHQGGVPTKLRPMFELGTWNDHDTTFDWMMDFVEHRSVWTRRRISVLIPRQFEALAVLFRLRWC